MNTLRLFVIRHGETAWTNARYSGWRDIPLAPEGYVQAEAVARTLSGAKPVAVYASPLERARATAEVIAKPHQLEVRVDPAFREMGFGAWEGLTRDEVVARFPAEHATWREAPHTVTPPGAERVETVAGRVAAGVAEIRRAYPQGTVVLVSHGVVIRLMVLAALGLGPERLWSVDASPCGITELEFAGDWVTVHRMNTLAHLVPEAAR